MLQFQFAEVKEALTQREQMLEVRSASGNAGRQALGGRSLVGDSSWQDEPYKESTAQLLRLPNWAWARGIMGRPDH